MKQNWDRESEQYIDNNWTKISKSIIKITNGAKAVMKNVKLLPGATKKNTNSKLLCNEENWKEQINN